MDKTTPESESIVKENLLIYAELVHAVLSDGFEELGQVFHSPTWDYLVRGIEERGLEFLTLDLPELEKDLLIQLEFRRLPANWPVQDGVAVFAPLLPLLFSGEHPVIPEDRAQAARHLRLIRQVFLLFSKVKQLPSEDRVADAVESWFEVEETLKSRRTAIAEALTPALRHHVRHLFRGVFHYVENALVAGTLPFKHGPGAVSEPSVFGAKKFSLLFPGWTARADKVSPRWTSTLASFSEYEDRGYDDETELVSPRNERSTRVVLIPKTAKSPRVIAMEPAVHQYGQQLLMQLFQDAVKHLGYDGVDWTDQTRNQELARKGSVDGSLATLDLSEASDRLSLQVVAAFLPPYLKRWVMAFRSTTASLKDRVVRLEKFAPMGSALTFVMESLVFYGVASYACMVSGMDMSSRRIVNRQLSAYGDDLIVPTEYAPAVISHLESIGLKVNLRKSFWSGYFRESCGADWLYGYDVSVVRVRQLLENSRKADAAISLCETQNQFFLRRAYRTAKVLRKVLSHLPANNRSVSSGYLCLQQEAGDLRWNSSLQALEAKVCIPRFRSTSGDGWDGLRSWMSAAGRRPEKAARVCDVVVLDDDVIPPFQALYSRPKPMGLGFGWSQTTGLAE